MSDTKSRPSEHNQGSVVIFITYTRALFLRFANGSFFLSYYLMLCLFVLIKDGGKLPSDTTLACDGELFISVARLNIHFFFFLALSVRNTDLGCLLKSPLCLVFNNNQHCFL